VRHELEHLLEARVTLDKRDGDGASSPSAIARRARSISSGVAGGSGSGTAARRPASKHASSARRSPSRLGSHSHSSATPGNPR